MKIEIKEDERIDDLQYKGLKIIQDTTGFCFGIDSVILANFVKDVKKGAKIVDLGTGTGILPILLSGKTEAKEIMGVEIQEEVAEMAKRSVKLNNLENKIKILNKDIKNIIEENVIDKNSVDIVVMNPPYKEKEGGKININTKKFISRHETTADLEDFIKIAKQLLKDKGTLYLVHKPERLVDIIYTLRSYKIEPKVIKIVHSKVDSEGTLLLIKAVKGGSSFLKIEKPLYIYNEDNNYTQEINEMYLNENN